MCISHGLYDCLLLSNCSYLVYVLFLLVLSLSHHFLEKVITKLVTVYQKLCTLDLLQWYCGVQKRW